MLSKVTIKEGANTTVTDYGYNSDDQLVKVNQTVNGKKKPTIAYEYDTDGNRIAKDVNDGTKNTHYHYHRDTSGELFLESIEGIKREDKIKYHRDADGNLLSFSFNDAVYYYQFNARGDVIALTDKAGSTKATYEYDEWGNVTVITGDKEIANVNIYRYVGKYGVMYDADTNLYLMGWRDYDPSIGRFIVPDEYEGTEEDPTSLNRYLMRMPILSITSTRMAMRQNGCKKAGKQRRNTRKKGIMPI
jgi:RHS repeat-associated protein